MVGARINCCSSAPRIAWIRFAATIAEQSEGINAPALKASVYAMALVLLVSSLFLSVGGSIIKRRFRAGSAR